MALACSSERASSFIRSRDDHVIGFGCSLRASRRGLPPTGRNGRDGDGDARVPDGDWIPSRAAIASSVVISRVAESCTVEATFSFRVSRPSETAKRGGQRNLRVAVAGGDARQRAVGAAQTPRRCDGRTL